MASSPRSAGSPGRRAPHASRGPGPSGGPRKRRPANRWRFYVLLAILGLIVVVVLALTVGRSALAQWLPGEAQQQPSVQESVAEPEPSGPDEQDLANPVACESHAIALDLTLEESAPRAGQSLPMAVTVTNSGEVPCLVDLGHGSVTVHVTSGDDDIWSTDACPRGDAEHELLLDIGAQTEHTVTWPGQRCDNDQDAEPGTYRVEVSLPATGGGAQESLTLELR